MVKMLLFSFKQCFGPFVMLLVEESFETELFRDLLNDVFQSPSVQKYISHNGHPFFEKLNLNFENGKKKIKKCFFLKVFTSEVVAKNCLYWEENTCPRQSMDKQRVLRFCMSLRETFTNWIDFTEINKSCKGFVVQISTVFRPVYHFNSVSARLPFVSEDFAINSLY